MKGKRGRMIFANVLALVSSVSVVFHPMLYQRLVDDVVIPKNTGPLLSILVTLFIIYIVRLGLRYIMHMCLEADSSLSMTVIRRDIYNTVQNQDYRFLGRFPTGNMMTRMTQDLDRLRHTVASISHTWVDQVSTFVTGLIYLLFVNWQLTLCIMAIAPLAVVASQRFKRIISPRIKLLRDKLTDLGTVVTENIDGNRVVKAFAREDYEIEHFEKHNVDFREISMDNALAAAKFRPVMDVLSNLLPITTLVAGGIFMIKGQLSPGEYLAFSSVTWTLANPMNTLPNLLADMERFNASATMLREVLEAPRGIADAPDAVDMGERIRGGIEFRNVNLSIGENEVLKDISFKLEPGQTLGILGSTGSGKTSLINLLTRLYEPDSGEVLIDGVDVRRYTLSSLRRHIGVAMQDVFLFSDTVKANIAYGRPELDPELIKNRALQADADGFIRQMQDGYDTLVGERGVGLSGGQRQRIALARALAVDPALLILDDTTSAVDSETEQYIQEQLRNPASPCTKIVIAQRLSSFRGADQILVMDKGRIIERGTHEELVAMKGFYHHIWRLQYTMGDDGAAEGR
jgi:ATP-binding cassette subfamily B protein